MIIGIDRLRAAVWQAAPLLCSVSTAALAQALNYTTFGTAGSTVTMSSCRAAARASPARWG